MHGLSHFHRLNILTNSHHLLGTLLLVFQVAVWLPSSLAQTASEYAAPENTALTWENAGDRFLKANDLYAEGRYAAAASEYETLLQAGYQSPELQYNLGNSYFKLAQTGKAILAYERALLLDAHFEDAAYNLELAQLNIKDSIEPLPVHLFARIGRGVVGLFSADGWALLASILLWLALFGFSIYGFSSQMRLRKTVFVMGLLCLSFFAISLLMTLVHANMDNRSREAIIMSPSAIVKSEPNEAATNLYILHEGLKLQVLEQVGDWKRVRLADGNIGWVPAENLEEV